MSTRDLGLSIGALAKAVGVAVETLRTWERRYGYPVPVRRPSGHRRYPLSTVDRLRKITVLIERGHKPSEVIPLDEASLDRLLGVSEQLPSPAPRSEGHPWFDALVRLDEPALTRTLQTQWARLDAVGFLDDFLAPLMVETGNRWAQGSLTIAQEHFASAVVIQFLANRWRPISAVQTGPVAVAATPSGEHHLIGLHMAALALSTAAWRVRFIGADTPVEGIAATASATDAQAVILGASPSLSSNSLAAQLTELRAELPDTPIWVGGVRPIEGVQVSWASSIGELYRWARGPRLANDAAQAQ